MMGCTGGVMKAKFTKGRDEALQGGRLAMGRTLTTFSALQPDVCHRLSAECRVIDEFVATCDRAIPARTQPNSATQRLLEAVSCAEGRDHFSKQGSAGGSPMMRAMPPSPNFRRPSGAG